MALPLQLAIKIQLLKDLQRVERQAGARAKGSLGRTGPGGIDSRAFYRKGSGKVSGRVGTAHPLGFIFEQSGRNLGRGGADPRNRRRAGGLTNLFFGSNRIYPKKAKALFIPGIGFRAWVRQSRMQPRPTLIPAFLVNQARMNKNIARVALETGVKQQFGAGVRFAKKVRLVI